MSGMASLYNVPSTDEERAHWSFVHMAHHRDINRRLYELVHIALPEYIIDPIDPNNTGTWEYQHQVMHDNQNALLGIAGFDLTGIDWKKQNELAAWIYLNASEHFKAADILEIG